jgi:hypothetical protein
MKGSYHNGLTKELRRRLETSARAWLRSVAEPREIPTATADTKLSPPPCSVIRR